MRYYGGGIGHLNNSLPRQADSLDSNSSKADEPEGEENIEEDAARDAEPQDVIMRDEEPEVAENDDADGDDDEVSTDPECYDYSKHNDESEDSEGSTSTGSSDEEDSGGYASP